MASDVLFFKSRHDLNFRPVTEPSAPPQSPTFGGALSPSRSALPAGAAGKATKKATKPGKPLDPTTAKLREQAKEKLRLAQVITVTSMKMSFLLLTFFANGIKGSGKQISGRAAEPGGF